MIQIGMKKALIFGILICCVLSCQKEENVLSNSPQDVDGFEVITNENVPGMTEMDLVFEENLSITKEGWWPQHLFIDEEDNIYVYTADGPINLIKYNNRGEEVLRKQFLSGQGPGEFKLFDPNLSQNGKIVIVDSSQRRLTVLNDKFEIEKIQKINFWGLQFTFDSFQNMYYLQVDFLPNTTNRQKLILTKCSPDGQPLKRYHEYEWGFRKDPITGKLHTEGFRPQIRYRLDDQGQLYFAMSDSYEIRQYSAEGRLLKKIIKKGRPRDLTQEEKESFSSKSSNPRVVYDIPDHMPFIADIFVLEKDYLLVVTFESVEHALSGDLFDNTGRFLTTVKVPKYYRWDFLDAPAKTRAVVHGNCFYSIEADENEDHFYVRRYKLTMK